MNNLWEKRETRHYNADGKWQADARCVFKCRGTAEGK